MLQPKKLGRFLLILLLSLMAVAAVLAKDKKGDKLLAEGKDAEQRKQYDRALELYEQALNKDPGNAAYMLAVRRVRFQAAQAHVDRGQKLRAQGDLQGALAEFQKAYATDPSSSIAAQEMQRTHEMMERDKKPGAPQSSTDRGLTPTELARKQLQAKLSTLQGAPELRPLTPTLSSLKMNNQPVNVLYDTVGKLAGVNVVFDPDIKQQANGRFSVDLTNNTLEQALDYLAVITKTFWKPLSSNTIFVTLENPNKRRDYEDQTVKVFYLQNTTSPQEVTEISTALRTILDLRRVFIYNAQNAIIIRGTTDQVLLAQKLVYDMDKPKPEVVVDVVVMEASRTRSHDIALALNSASGVGLSVPIGFTPRNPILSGGTTSTSTSGTTSNSSSATNPITNALGTSTTTAATTGSSAISLAQVAHVGTNDFSLTLPGALFSLVAGDSRTRILQNPQVRSVDNQKATLKIGERIPIATGSFGSSIGAVGAGISPLVQTQFNYQDVGVNIDIQPHIHGRDEVSLHVEIEISNVDSYSNIGGISQPIIGQRKIVHDVRMREGEVNMLGGLQQNQRTRNNSGLPGLVHVPFLRAILGEDKTENDDSEIVIALIPHIVRTPNLDDLDMREVLAGNDQLISVRRTQEGRQPVAPSTPAPAMPAATTPAATTPAATTPAPISPVMLPPGSARLTLNPPTNSVAPNTPVTLTLSVDNAKDLYTAPLRIKYDQGLLELQDIRPGTLFSGDGQEPVFAKDIRNEAGEAVVALTRPNGAPGVTGSGTLLVLTFKPLARGTASIDLPEVSLKDTKMQPIAVKAPTASVIIQ